MDVPKGVPTGVPTEVPTDGRDDCLACHGTCVPVCMLALAAVVGEGPKPLLDIQGPARAAQGLAGCPVLPCRARAAA